MKKYRAIFFDWDGTAVKSRRAPVNEVIIPMKKLLSQGVKLAVISGTTIENIGEGKLHEHFSLKERGNLFYGLGRGAYNYKFDEEGRPEVFCHRIPEGEELLKIHRACYDIHEYLLKEHNFPTDVVFSRPNYCKIDLMVSNDRGENLFFQEGELDALKRDLMRHGFADGPSGLVRLAERIGKAHGLTLTATTDAKYLEAGISSKSDNVNAIFKFIADREEIHASECAFWGDEYVGMDAGLFGSDSFMITEKTGEADFFDVSEAAGMRPEKVKVLGGGVEQFLAFLEEQTK